MSHYNVAIYDAETEQRWQEAEKVVAQELDVDVGDLTRQDVARELAEAYLGGDALGRWREA